MPSIRLTTLYFFFQYGEFDSPKLVNRWKEECHYKLEMLQAGVECGLLFFCAVTRYNSQQNKRAPGSQRDKNFDDKDGWALKNYFHFEDEYNEVVNKLHERQYLIKGIMKWNKGKCLQVINALITQLESNGFFGNQNISKRDRLNIFHNTFGLKPSESTLKMPVDAKTKHFSFIGKSKFSI